MSRQLHEPITDSGIRNPNFFNGRLLTADDLNVVLTTNRQQHRQLGQGIGEGIIYGLEVETATGSTGLRPVLRVSEGLALNRQGDAVALALKSVDVALVRDAATFPPEAGLFAACTLPEPSDNLSNIGVYVFTATPTSTYEGSVPTRHSLTNSNFGGCGKRYAVEGIKFRLERIDLATLEGVSTATRTQLDGLLKLNDAASLSKLRNILAHLCFDTEETNGQRRDPFKSIPGVATFVNYGALAALRSLGQLTECDVPLALIYWSREGVQFVDTWAVRRLARRLLDLDVFSILRSYGYERLLQFQRHLQDLFERLGGLASVQLQNYFQYLPPVGYYPVSGTKSPRGFHQTNLLGQYTTGVPSQITVERFGALLRESFACPDVNLQTKPVLQLFRVRDNESAVEANASTQRYQVFVTRELNGPLLQDGVAKSLYDAWEVYRGLIKRRIFLPPGTDDAKIGAQLTITSAIRYVLDMSNRQHTLAAATALDTAGALNAFLEMHRIQDELATLFQTNIPGIQDTQQREIFGRLLGGLLNLKLPDGRPGLRPAVQANNLSAAVDAQTVINMFVGGWSGEGVAIGPFGSSWQSSPQGKNLVPARVEPFPHHFLVNNGTDKRLNIQLSATATAAHGDWSNSTTIENEAGTEIPSVDLAPGTNTTVVVKVKAPSNAQVDDTVTLTLETTAPPPTNITTRSSITDLKVAAGVGTAVTRSVVYDGPVVLPSISPDNATSNMTFGYGYNLRYTAPVGDLNPANFRLIVNLTSETVTQWAVRILDLSSQTTGQNGVFQRTFDLTPGASRLVQVVIRTPLTPSTSERTASFTVRVESVNLTPTIFADHPQTFTIRVRANT
ncbi:MAG TPA: hypothetical protein VM911_14470 [Pyrinomonadaceae bacterium]|jgi:hypothetical protein|nr:hypothetical protein [Pyrinomonadaceae bacterium]